jgi:hypothetical protein
MVLSSKPGRIFRYKKNLIVNSHSLYDCKFNIKVRHLFSNAKFSQVRRSSTTYYLKKKSVLNKLCNSLDSNFRRVMVANVKKPQAHIPSQFHTPSSLITQRLTIPSLFNWQLSTVMCLFFSVFCLSLSSYMAVLPIIVLNSLL